MTEREKLRELIYAWEYEENKVSIADCDADKSIERLIDKLLANGVIVPPCKVGDTVYHIAKCADFHSELDGTLYDIDGGIGSATGYYCPCELRNNCPFDNEEDFDCEKQKSKLVIFEDEVKGFVIGEYEETIILLDYTGNEYIHEFGKTVFLNREEAEKALEEMQDENRKEIDTP